MSWSVFMSSWRNIAALATRLFFNGIRFRLLRALRRPGKIKALSLEITHRCICRCIMCNIWKLEDHTPELSMAEWADMLSDDIFSELVELDITGGEPFLVDGLPGFFRRLVEYKGYHLQQLRSVAITTNAILTERVLENTKCILQVLEGSGIQLVLACAMDGVDGCHDQIRGFPGAFARMQATLQELIVLRTQNPSLILGVKTTIVPGNVKELGGIDAFARQQDLFSIVSPCIITGGRFLNSELDAELRFRPDQIDGMVRFYAGNDRNWSVHGRSLAKILRGQRFTRPCCCGFNYAFIRSSGDVYLCPLFPSGAGSVKDADFRSAWHSRQGRELRGRMGRSAACLRCTEPGLERYALVHEGWSYLFFLVRLGPRRFEQLHAHLGLQSYFVRNSS